MSETKEEPTAPPAKRQRVDESGTSNGFNAATDADNATDLTPTSGTSIPLLPRDTKVLLLDIEGCTTSISFVHDVLFPFALNQLPSYLKDDARTSEELDSILTSLKEDVSKLDADHPSRKELEKESSDDTDKDKDTDTDKDAKQTTSTHIIAHVKALMDHDVKATGLKSLQGTIWKEGYKSGELKGHIYQDFKPMLEWCKSQNVSVNIYSSGSIGAQKLLFGHSLNGDLCHFFNSHFDTTSGGKKEAASYGTIAKALGVDVKEICFVSDAEAELVAAREAGIGFVVMSVRPGNAPLTDIAKGFPNIYSLLQLCGSGE